MILMTADELNRARAEHWASVLEYRRAADRLGSEGKAGDEAARCRDLANKDIREFEEWERGVVTVESIAARAKGQ